MPKKRTVKNKKVQKNTSKKVVNKNVEKSNDSQAKRQLSAIVTFAFALFLLAVVFIKGGNAWLFLHNALFGLFGVCTYALPIFIGLIAVLCALDKFSGDIKTKIIESCILVMLVDAAVDIFTTADALPKFIDHIKDSWILGAKLQSGGFFGALIGHPLSFLFEKTGAAITVILLIFVFVLIITGTTLIKFFKTLASPVKKLEQVAENSYYSLINNQDDDEDDQVIIETKNNGKRNKIKLPPKETDDEGIDISLTEEEEIEKRSVSSKEKKNKLIDLYNGVTPEVVTTSSEHVDEEIIDVTKENEEIELEETTESTQKEIDVVEFEVPNEEMEPEKPSYVFPPISLLAPVKAEDTRSINSELESTGNRLVEVLSSFGVEAKIINISRGPAVTRYELKPSAGVKISKITNLSDDIALNLASSGIRIEAPIPNKSAVGIEVPNKSTSVVNVREIIDSPAFENSKSKLTIALGKDIAGSITVTDISKMPHGLIAGATGSGKSVCINSIIISLLYNATPEEVKLLLIDPKVVELGIYNGIPHLLVPVVTDPRKAAGSLGWAVQEMEHRYKLFAENDVRSIDGYNELAEMREDLAKMPRIVIIIDELADLMMTAPGDVESSIMRITQKARAAGIHLIVATQRPSVDVVTGLIKANIPTRVAFAVSSQIDSRTILDVGGAEKLMGRGDMLFCPYGANKPLRIQGCYVSDSEVEAVVGFIKKSQKSDYSEEVAMEIERLAVESKNAKGGNKQEDSDNGDDSDPELNRAIEVVVEAGHASTSLLQKRLKLGYARASRIIDQMEARGIVEGYKGSKPRNVLISRDQLNEMKMRSDDEE